MALFASKKEIVALDIGSNSVKVVQLSNSKKGWELKKLGIAYLPPEAIVDGSIIDSMTVTSTVVELLKEHKIKAVEAVSSLTGHSVIIKKVSLPAMTEEELGESIQWEAEQYIPFPVSEVNLDFQILGEDVEVPGQMEVMLVAVKKDVINDYTNVIKEAELTPVIMDVDAFAVENMMEINYTVAPEENLALVNIGASVTTISVVSGGMTVFTRSVPIGGNQFSEELQRQLNISYQDAENLKMGREVEAAEGQDPQTVLEPVISNMIGEVKRSIDFYLSGVPGAFISKIYLSGGGSKLSGLKDIIQEGTAIATELVNPFNSIASNPKDFDPSYLADMGPNFAVAVGLATRRLGDR